jgi:hypothetical protein
MASNGKGKPKGARKMAQISQIPVSMYFINFKILSNITHPFGNQNGRKNYHQVEPCRPPLWKWLSH